MMNESYQYFIMCFKNTTIKKMELIVRTLIDSIMELEDEEPRPARKMAANSVGNWWRVPYISGGRRHTWMVADGEEARVS